MQDFDCLLKIWAEDFGKIVSGLDDISDSAEQREKIRELELQFTRMKNFVGCSFYC